MSYPSEQSDQESSDWTQSLSNTLSEFSSSVKCVLSVFGFIASFSLFITLVTLWVNFQDAYLATTRALTAISPLMSGLFPSILVGSTVFVAMWCIANGWYCIIVLRANFDSDIKARTALKSMAPDIEACLHRVVEYLQIEDDSLKERRWRRVYNGCLTIWEESHELEFEAPVFDDIHDALGNNAEGLDAEELVRLLRDLAPLSRRGNVDGVRKLR